MTTIPVPWRCPIACVVVKPAGLATQAVAGIPSLEARLREQFQQSPGPSTASESTYLALPHRLDRAVGGVMLVALTKRAARLLGQQFESRKVCKSYVAWVEGDWRVGGSDSVTPDGWVAWRDRIRKLPDIPRVEIVESDAVGDDAKDAVTHVRMIRRHQDRTLLELRPQTGRMHQLRVQCAHRGLPIIGDEAYGAGQSAAWREQAARIAIYGDAIALHAARIGFHDPVTGRWTEVTELPAWDADPADGTRWAVNPADLIAAAPTPRD